MKGFCGVVLSLGVCLSFAEIYPYNDFLLNSRQLIYRESGMFSHADAPSKMHPGKGRSFIKFTDLRFKQVAANWNKNNNLWKAVARVSAEGKNATAPTPSAANLDVAVFLRGQLDKLGFETGKNTGQREYCCSQMAVRAGFCSEPGRLVVPSNIHVARLSIPPGQEVHVLTGSTAGQYNVSRTGMYTVLIANCDESHSVLITGHTEWMNPFGYLPGEYWGNLPFFGWMSLLYLGLGILWTILCLRQMKDLLPVQLWISFVLFLGMVETTTKYFDFLAWDEEGHRNLGAMVFGMISGVCKRALSRMLVLIVSLGYGVVKPSLGNTFRMILMLGAAYLGLSLTYDLLSGLPSHDKDLAKPAFIDLLAILVLLQSFIDVVFYMWILQALTRTIFLLKTRKQWIKYMLFERFRLVLIISVLFSVAWSIFSIVMSTGSRLERDWQEAWTVPAIWEVLYLLILVAICVLWRPSINNQRYAYSMQLATDESGAGGIQLSGMLHDDEEEGGGERRKGDKEEEGEYGGGLLLADSDELLTIAGMDAGEQQMAVQKME
uniref:GOST seven transmembrane domain-containing protein n=1 Tax=Fibrocapsa japonica TaxID=94617 RepID=A0A7S2XZ88_9STRA|mmetsp:Transcript_2378/g.3512  ORF Transcript_2378/g.3512 Transcript_2378/m.3512 type:complete len:548 (+) Transcript_2378:144-1787(+)|eukprot:CAMPEP_0113937064 /NCGR_PEP_ID=MMETSP1339-20121228/3767_1 /TAXON_ID=94617 /ORGANISM="Fibrocapsa japonica" /LENGTH=547 /DNA_ID=CAMNT_0000939697 /DNA_START=110 /DNA_END=1753 /DNA_ORIENTATION=- /assembly_acc=CAM_ASM_000762